MAKLVGPVIAGDYRRAHGDAPQDRGILPQPLHFAPLHPCTNARVLYDAYLMATLIVQLLSERSSAELEGMRDRLRVNAVTR